MTAEALSAMYAGLEVFEMSQETRSDIERWENEGGCVGHLGVMPPGYNTLNEAASRAASSWSQKQSDDTGN